MISIKRTNSKNQEFKNLVKLLDASLAISDGDEHSFYDQFNNLDTIKHVVVAYMNDKPIGCGAIKTFDERTMEVKRMFTAPEFRGQGVASIVLKELENWASELSIKRCILETGMKQPEAIGLYQKKGYQLIKNYGQYIGIANSRCFEKLLSKTTNEK